MLYCRHQKNIRRKICALTYRGSKLAQKPCLTASFLVEGVATFDVTKRVLYEFAMEICTN